MNCSPDFQLVFDATPGNYLLLSPDLTIIGVNECYLRATMTVREQIIGRGLFEIFPDNPDDPSADGVRNLRASLLRVLAHKRPDRMPLQKYDIRRPDGEGGGFEERYWSPLNTPVLDPGGEVRWIIHWVEDVTEFVRLRSQMQAEQALLQEELRARAGKIEAEVFLRVEAVEANRRLAEGERRYRFLADAVPQLVWTADASGAADYFNERWVEFTHLATDDLRGDAWLRTIHEDDRDHTAAAWAAAVKRGVERYQIEHRIRRHDGAYRWMLTAALPYRDPAGDVVKWFGTSTDIHDRVTAEEKLLQAQRLQAAGQLAGGVAHEVNNMMTVVIGSGEFALEGLGPEHPQRAEVEQMVKAASRAAEVTRQVLAFSRQQVLRLSVVDLNEIVHQLTPVLKRVIGSNRQLAVRPAREQIRVQADRGQIDQVLINLVANARDATGTDGLINIEVDAVELDRKTLDRHNEPDGAPGRFVRLTVRDNGLGMLPEVAARVFEPFFTTKAVGKGTGLGLAMVYGIAKQSGGFAEIDGRPGEGTRVAVYLPSVSAEFSSLPGLSGKAQGSGEGILVVEDEPQVRALVHRSLQLSGYRVYEAPTGLAALDFIVSHPGEVDLILTDVVMPRMTGQELADSLRDRFPSLPILFMSGYTGDEIQRRGLMQMDAPFIQKPFTPETIAAAVRELLDRVPNAPTDSLLSIRVPPKPPGR